VTFEVSSCTKFRIFRGSAPDSAGELIALPQIPQLYNVGRRPQIWPTQKFWRGAPYAATKGCQLGGDRRPRTTCSHLPPGLPTSPRGSPTYAPTRQYHSRMLIRCSLIVGLSSHRKALGQKRRNVRWSRQGKPYAIRAVHT